MKLRIEKPIYGGAGLARADGKAVFVPMALPGELVEVAIRRDKGGFAEAELAQVLEPSPARVAPPCPYYGACGGCQYQHARYAKQFEMKQAVLAETLERAGLRDLPSIAVHAGEPWGYRNRIRLHVEARTHALGYLRRNSRVLLQVQQCPVASPLLQRALNALQAEFARQKTGDWCSEAELFANAEDSALLLTLRGRAPGQDQLNKLCDAVRENIPELAGASLFEKIDEPKRSKNRRLPHQENTGAPLTTWGEPTLNYVVGSEVYRASAGAFFQGNRFLVETLAALAAGSERGQLAWDLFAGVGLFSRLLASRFEKVVAVEGSPISSSDLRHNLPQQRTVQEGVLSFLSRMQKQPNRPDQIVLDPPRAGLGQEGSALLARIHSQNVTYVSCDPATLSRDLQILVDAGYTLTELHLVDMFPQTFHIETVAKLTLS